MSAAIIAEGPLSSGKSHEQENFPVASRLIAPRFRAPILAFYRFARTGDDVSDHPSATPEEKLARLDAMRATLSGEADTDGPSLALRRICDETGVPRQHGLDLLEAFSRDCTKLRYADWDDLVGYCEVSANPVGRFVLDVHGESRDLWPVNDALCTALQIINHLQDCAIDYRALDRVYLPQDMLAEERAVAEDLSAPHATPALRRVLTRLARQTQALLEQSRAFAPGIRDRRLRLEVAIIQRLAESLCRRLIARDPLWERVHHSKVEAAGLALSAVLAHF